MLVLDLEAARRSILHLAFWDRMIAFCCYTVSVILFSCFFSCLSQCAALQSVTMVLAYFGSQLPCFGLFKKQLGFSIIYFLLVLFILLVKIISPKFTLDFSFCGPTTHLVVFKTFLFGQKSSRHFTI